MKNVFKVFGVIVLAAVIGFSMAVCGGDDGGGEDPALNGTWVINNEVWKFNNGLFEASRGGIQFMKGTYTTNNGYITLIITNIYGGNPEFAIYGLSSTWYSKKDLLLRLGVIDPQLEEIFLPTTEQYSINGNTFIWGRDTYTKDGGDTDPGTGGTAPKITTLSLPNGVVGTAYNQTLTATGNTLITWSRDSGTLPAGLSLAGTGVISGTPTTAGTSTFTVKATNAKGNDTKQLSITITGGATSGWTAVTNSTFGTSGIKAIAWGNNKFVAGGSDGKMAYSSDGVTWTAINTGTIFDYVYNGETRKGEIRGIAYGNGMFVAGGRSATMAVSTDGINWTAVDSKFGTGDDINTIAYGNGKFVAGGDRLAYSSDGVTWTRQSSPFASWDSINVIVYGNGKFVLGGSSDKLAYSTDGVTWTLVDSSIGGGFFQIDAIAYGSNKFITTGANVSREKMATSPDGVTWTAVDTVAVQFHSTWGKVYTLAFGNNKFIAAGNYGKMASSSDGLTWSVIDLTGIFGSSNIDTINAIAYDGNGKFVAGGSDGKMAYSTGN